MSPGTRTCV